MGYSPKGYTWGVGEEETETLIGFLVFGFVFDLMRCHRNWESVGGILNAFGTRLVVKVVSCELLGQRSKEIIVL